MRKLVSFMMAMAVTFSSFAAIIIANAEVDKPDWQFSRFSRSTIAPVIAGSYSYKSNSGFRSGGAPYSITSPIFRGMDGATTVVYIIDFKYSISLPAGASWTIITEIINVTTGSSLGVISTKTGTGSVTLGADTYWETGDAAYSINSTDDYQVKISASTTSTDGNANRYVKIDDIQVNTDLIVLSPSGFVYPDFSLSFTKGSSKGVFKYGNGKTYGNLAIVKAAASWGIYYDSTTQPYLNATLNCFKVNRSTGDIESATYTPYTITNIQAESVLGTGAAKLLQDSVYDYNYSLTYTKASGSYATELVGVAQPAIPALVPFLVQTAGSFIGVLSGPAACITSFTSNYYLLVTDTYGRFFSDVIMTTPLNGGDVWHGYKIALTSVTRPVKVNTTGYITDYYTCP